MRLHIRIDISVHFKKNDGYSRRSVKEKNEENRTILFNYQQYFTCNVQIAGAVLRDSSGCDALADQVLSSLQSRHLDHTDTNSSESYEVSTHYCTSTQTLHGVVLNFFYFFYFIAFFQC